MFVHGFFGNVIKTWQHFSELCDSKRVPGAETLARSDLFFFDYPAHKAFVKDSATELTKFMSRLFPRPTMELFGLTEDLRNDIRSPWLPYTRVLLVGHSLGAVVIRECIENQFRLADDMRRGAWIETAEISLFAPAHIGFKFSGIKELVFHLSPDIITSIPSLYRAFFDLQEKSNLLRDLRRRTERRAIEHSTLKCFRARALYGSKEDVVIPGEFDCDYTPEWVQGRNHVEICKPDAVFTHPIQFVTYDVRKTRARP
ncbi:MAG TPA: alpha/beta fold hydrolase [Bryobacteraceae bacterium]